MKSMDGNPDSNALPPGISEAQISAAIAKSGYPLQTVVATELREQFRVQEEWSYIDPDSESLRTIDILAEKYLYDYRKEGPRVRPILDLLVECKQSDLPYIFFLSGFPVTARTFPLVAGLHNDDISLKTDDSSSSWIAPVLSAMGLVAHPFASEKGECCATFGKCVRKGSDLELSGSEAYNSLLLPILKAMHHFKKAEAPSNAAKYFDCHLTLGLAVLDAPMVGVRATESGDEKPLLPWVRVMRHESHESDDWTKRSSLYAIEIIHKDFLARYLEKHLRPFADEFSVRVIRHQEEIATGQGFAPDMARDGFKEIEKRLRPR